LYAGSFYADILNTVADAIDWLDANSSKSIEDLKAEEEAAAQAKAAEAAEEAKSLVCNECGKKFRGTAQAEFHASKSGHTDFSESTEEVAPLNEEERKAKLAELRDKLAAKRAAQEEEDKIAQKRNEQINRKKTKETEDLKEQLRIKEQLKEAEKKKQEKQAEIDAKKRIQAKIAADKEERRLKAERERAARAGVAPPAAAQPPPPPTAAPAASKPASEYKETRLRLQTSSGNILKTFPVDTTLFEVAAAVGEETGRDVESFTQTFPRKVFGQEFFGESLKDLKLVPSASLIVK
jgi:DNA repair exonuclease SbcCD ATPase subunit